MARRKQSAANKIKATQPLSLKEDIALLGTLFEHREFYERIKAVQQFHRATASEKVDRERWRQFSEDIETAINDEDTGFFRLLADLVEVTIKGPRSPLEYALIQLVKRKLIPKRKPLSAYELAVMVKPELGFLPSTRQVASAANRVGIKTTGVRGISIRRRLK
jgi:hypothetical protein